MTTLRTVGKSIPRLDGIDKVLGRTKYAADLELPGMLWGKTLRSPHPHARIVHVDTSRARRIPGVHAVVTARDIPERLIGLVIWDMPVLARGKVRFIGERVAAVAAETPEIADEALLAIEVEYEELPAVFEALEAMEVGTPLVHEDPTSYETPPRPAAGTPKFFRYMGTPLPLEPGTNVNSHVYWEKGDIEAGFREAHHIFEHTFVTQRVHQTYLEPHSCVVWIDEETQAHVWASNKSPFYIRRMTAHATDVPREQITVYPGAVGGDFGGKSSPMDAPLAYILAKASGRPVKMVMTYIEEFTAANPRHPVTVTLRSGVTSDGRLTACHAKAYLNSGAYVGPGAGHGLPLISDAAGVYRTPNVRIDSCSVYTNSVPSGSFRGVGQPQVVFAVESHLDMIAKALGLDAVELRKQNLVRGGDTSPVGEAWQDIRAAETLQAAAEAIKWWDPKPGPNTGRGLSISEHHAIGGQTSATVKLTSDGAVTVLTPAPDQGAGLYLVLRQMVAELLTVPVEMVNVRSQDTSAAPPDTGVIGGSRATHVVGHVTSRAAQQLREKLITIASERFGCQPGQVRLQDGSFEHDGKRLTMADVAAEAPPEAVTGFFDGFIEEPEVTGFCVQAAEVEVDTETGQVHVRRLVSAHDVGTIINPIAHQGQVEGAVVQALGFAVMEEMQTSEGRITSTTFGDYKIPSVKDVPPLETVLLDPEGGTGPFQAKAIGEHPLANIAPAIANAISDAVGARIQSLPITSEKVYRALRQSTQT